MCQPQQCSLDLLSPSQQHLGQLTLQRKAQFSNMIPKNSPQREKINDKANQKATDPIKPTFLFCLNNSLPSLLMFPLIDNSKHD